VGDGMAAASVGEAVGAIVGRRVADAAGVRTLSVAYGVERGLASADTTAVGTEDTLAVCAGGVEPRTSHTRPATTRTLSMTRPPMIASHIPRVTFCIAIPRPGFGRKCVGRTPARSSPGAFALSLAERGNLTYDSDGSHCKVDGVSRPEFRAWRSASGTYFLSITLVIE
jgi:hypothetical protein